MFLLDEPIAESKHAECRAISRLPRDTMKAAPAEDATRAAAKVFEAPLGNGHPPPAA